MTETNQDEGVRSQELYTGLLNRELILRDHLAAGRTDLANERTLLAYIRTALAVFAGGITLVHFFKSIWLTIIGWMFVPLGIAILIVGAVRCKRMNDRIRWMRQNGSPLGKPPEDSRSGTRVTEKPNTTLSAASLSAAGRDGVEGE